MSVIDSFTEAHFSEPMECCLCHCEFTNSKFVDGVIPHAGWKWGLMCTNCHDQYGLGIGPGKGQLFQKVEDIWVKIA